MEWVETTARTVDEAKELALDRLGVDETDAEFEVMDEPKPGLFGRIRGEARVRARVRPTTPRPKAERRDRKRAAPKEAAAVSAAGGNGGGTADEAQTAPATDGDATAAPARTRAPRPPRTRAAAAANGAGVSDPVPGGARREAEAAQTFLTGLVAAFGLEGAADIIELDEGDSEIRVEGDDLGLLIGPRGQTLLAVQDLTRLAAQPRDGERQGRLRVDIGGYRQRREEALIRFTNQVASEVASTGVSRALEPMTAVDRKIVHDAASAIPGVLTGSEGEDPFRRVVIRPAADG